MFQRSKLSRVALAIALCTSVANTAIAQETVGGMRGTILSQSGNLVTGATITITDTRTGAVKVINSNDTGAFSSRGMRVGGPYTIEVTDDAGTKKITDVYLSLGETLTLNIGLESPENIERISVTAIAGGVLTETKGPSANFTFEDLQFQPNVNRDIKDVLSTDPRISINPTNSNSIECAGANNRFNSLTVDGVRQNDNFGLNNNGYPTEGLPFPFDAIDQVAVELAPFDVEYGGFTGCNINAVTRSGTNEFHGNVFVDYTDDSLRGDSIEGRDFEIPAFDEMRFGFTLGGPIIKDKLFFFAAYEEHDPTDVIDNGPEGFGFPDPIAGVDQALIDQVRSIALNTYGYEVGEIVRSVAEQDKKVLLKLDWQITEDHRAQYTYQKTDSFTNSASGTSENSFAFNDRYYRRQNDLETHSLQIFSDWSDSFSTEFRVGRLEVTNGQVPGTTNPEFGSFTVEDIIDGVDFNFGADILRQANQLNYETDQFKFAGTYFTGDHEITGGIEYEAVSVFNLFVPRSQGEFRFIGLDNFINQQMDEFRYAIPASLNAADGAAEFEFRNTVAYIQDKWNVNADLTLTFGLRYDQWDADSDPLANPNFESRYGFTNGNGPDLDLLQPRLGVNYIIDDTTFVYGGVGLFSGGNPNVWMSNNYSNNGVTILGSRFRSRDLDNPDVAFVLDGTNTPGLGVNVPALATDPQYFRGGDGAVNALDPNFDMPSLWKYNVGIQKEWNGGYLTGLDVIYTREKNSPKAVALNVAQVGVAPDGRPLYNDVDFLDPDCADPTSDACSGRASTDYLLTNMEEDGDGLVVSTFVEKTFDFGLTANFAYAYQDIQSGSPMNASTVSSNYGNLSVIDPNNPGIATANYETEHRFTLQLNYEREFFDGYATRINLFATRQKGRPYSINFDREPTAFGDERNFEDRHLLYIPAGPGATDDPRVVYGEGFDLAAFNAYIASEGLEGARGSIMGRNSQNSPWWTRVDIQITQEIPGFMDGHSGTVYLAIENFGNLLNDDWGVFQQVNFEHNVPVVDASIVNGQYVYENFDGFRGYTIDNEASTWSAIVGVNYRF